VNTLLTAVGEKFGMKKGINQLTRSIGLLFNANVTERDTFSGVTTERTRFDVFPLDELRKVRKIYPILVVQDFAMANGFMNRRLRLQFVEKLRERSIDVAVNVRPLSLLTVENLENVLEHIGEITLTDVLEEYASEKHQPLSTFNGVLNDYLEVRNLDTTRRYAWSVTRCQEILSSIQDRFIKTLSQAT